ncbi:MAG: secretin N-terminal domain-containing protein [Opitutaceae bacterium]
MIARLQLADSPVDVVLDTLTIYTGRAVLRPPQGLPAGNYTIDIRNIRTSEAIIALETLLSMNGIAVTPMNDRMMKVTALNIAKTEAPEMITGSTLELPKSGRIATKVFHLEFMRVQDFITAISGLFNPLAQGVAILPSANVAMITDTVSTLQRVEMLVKEFDKPMTSGMNAKFYTLKNGAKASDVVNRIRGAFGNTMQQQLGSSTTFSADDRTNQIILIADPRLHPVFDELIDKLDIKADPNTRNDIISLKHAKAADVRTIVNELVNGQQRQRSTAQSVRPGQFQPPNPFPTQPNVPLGATGAPGGIGAPGGAGGVPGGPGAPVIQIPQNQAPAISGLDGAQPSSEFSTMVNVVEDPRSNSIIVSGTADDVRLIKELVAKIDTILAQVNIEVIIAEVTLNNTQRSGLQALNLTVGTDTPGAADTGRGTHITNFAGNVAGWAVTDGVVNPLAFKAALTDAGGRNSLKILQAVTIMTAHGSPGNIIVGEKRPIVTGSQSQISGTGTTPVTNQTYQITPITLDLKVTPFIGDDGSIQLTIDQKIEDVIGSTTINNDPVPIIGTRQAISNLNIFDGQMIVLGGLQRTKNSRDRTKIGFIYEIPILSHILGARTNIAERTELLLFIRPKVMRLENSTPDTLKTIESLSNREQIKQYLEDPSKRAKESLLEKIK